MCGIAGALSLDGRPVSHAAVRAMTDALAHRGPDEGAVRMIGPGSAHLPPVLGLGHRRLKILDLTPAASQPMYDPAGGGVLVYNGELYNAPELRRELEGRGLTFRSRSDTEVVLQALITWGAGALPRFNGMFALAFWETRQRRLILARDRFGEKPLYYAVSDGTLRFASELGALAQDGRLALNLDDEAVELYFTFGFIPSPWTIYRGARKLPHASCLIAGPGVPPRIERYFRLEDWFQEAPPEDPEEAVRQALRDAVRRRLASDVPLGAFLSGGIDSSAVVAMMTPALEAPPRTFSMSVPGLGYFDETRRARAVATRFGSLHQEVQVDAPRLMNEIPIALDALDEPFADSSILAASLLAREARHELTVALSGDGGDEVFGGYRLYRALAARSLLQRLPAPALRLARAAARRLPSRHGGGLAGAVHRGRKFLDGAASDLALAHAAWMSIEGGRARRELQPGAPDARIGQALVAERYRRFGGDLERTLAVEIDLPLPDDMLTKVDRASMRHALEVRVPFLDPEVVRLALSTPARAHFNAFGGKRLLRRALRGILPREVLRGPKRGFEVPVGHWLGGVLREMFHDVASPRALASIPGAEPRAVERWLDEHRLRRADHGVALWAVFAWCWWQAGPRARQARAAHWREESRSEVMVFSRSEG